MADRACCDDIIEAQANIERIDREFALYREDAQRWRTQHSEHNSSEVAAVRKDMTEIRSDLQDIKKMLTSWVNPVVAVVISALTAVMGILAGALWVIASK